MLKLENIELVVFDMAGTTVDEGGVVYQTLDRILREEGADYAAEDFNHWHGANKVEVVRHFLLGGQAPAAEVDRVYGRFQTELKAAYFGPASPVKPITGAVDCFERLRAAGVKVALDTGYPRPLAQALVDHNGFGPHIDALIVSEDVGAGRPFPYMIHALMKQLGLMDVRRVAKAGDTARDMEEGVNAGCGLVVGVLSGADEEATLRAAGAHVVIASVAEIGV